MMRPGSTRVTRRGAVAPLAALLMIAMLAMVAFAVDIGYIVLARSEAQNAADSAAMAGLGKLSDRLRGAKLVNGKPLQTQDDLDAARAEAKSFALKNTVGGQGADVKDAEVEFGYLSDPYNQSSSLDTSGWPDRPYNAVRVTVYRDKDHSGGSLGLFFGKVLGFTSADLSATATACVALGTPQVKGNSASGRGALLPFTYPVDVWHALLQVNQAGSLTIGTETVTISDNYRVDLSKTGTASVSSGSDNMMELRLYPNVVTSGNFGTINFTTSKSSNSTSTLRDLIQNGPAAADWPDLADIVKATPSNPVSVNGDPGISAGMESAVQSIIGQPRVLPLYRSVSGNGNNTFYDIVEFVPVTIGSVELSGGNKHIIVQPRIANVQELIDGTNRLDFSITPSSDPNLMFLGHRSLVR